MYDLMGARTARTGSCAVTMVSVRHIGRDLTALCLFCPSSAVRFSPHVGTAGAERALADLPIRAIDPLYWYVPLPQRAASRSRRRTTFRSYDTPARRITLAGPAPGTRRHSGSKGPARLVI